MAGFAESHSVLHYNNFADISWGHPSDGCHGYSPYGQYCFYIIEKNAVKKPFHGALQKINIPAASHSSLVIMESTEDQWIIYDLESQGIIFENGDVELALQKWQDLGLPQITFANATNLSDYFAETEESKEKNRMSAGELFWFVVIFVFYAYWKFWLAMSLFILSIFWIHKGYFCRIPKIPEK